MILEVTKESLSPAEVELKVSVPGDEVTGRIEEAVTATAKRAKLPGFRPGKVPRSVVVQRFGQQITSEIVQEVLQEAYKQALAESAIEPISPGEMSEVHYHPGEPLSFTVKIEVAPEIDIPPLTDITVELPQPQISDEDVALALDNLRESQAALVPTDENVSTDSVVTFDMQEIDKTGVPILGRSRKDMELDLSRTRPGDQLTSQLIGLKAGDTTVIETSPEKGAEKQEKGRLKVEVTNVRRKELPALNDDFARSVNPNAESVETLQADLKRYMEVRASHKAHEQMFRSIVDTLLRRTDFTVPERMLERYLNDLAHQAIHGRDQKHGRKHEQDPKQVEHFKEEYRASAIWNLRWHLLRKRIIKESSLEVTDEEYQGEIERMARLDDRPPAEFQKRLTDEQKNHIREDLLERKVLDLLEKQVQIIPRPVPLAEFEGRTESKLVTV